MAVLWVRKCEEFDHFCQNTTSFRSTFFEISILENQKKRGTWVGNIELPYVACFRWSKNKAPEDDPRRTEGDR